LQDVILESRVHGYDSNPDVTEAQRGMDHGS
jgi:hypothetical protein